MKSFEKFTNSLREAWELVIDVRYPFAFEDPQEPDPVLQAVLIPFCGCIAGILLAALGKLIPGGGAGSLLWALIALFLLDLKDSGRAVKFISQKISCAIFKNDSGEFVSALNVELMLLRLAALFVIVWQGTCGGMIPVLTAVFAVESFLAVNNPVPVIELEDRERKFIWIIPAAVAFLAFWSMPLFTVVCAALSAAVVWCFKTRVWKEEHPVSGDDITLCAGVVELLLLICAMMIL
jgi:hypothetical protein